MLGFYQRRWQYILVDEYQDTNTAQYLWLRLIAQYVETERDVSLYANPDDFDDETGFLSASAVFAYKLNWQTVLFVGYGDNRELSEFDRLEPAGLGGLRPPSYQKTFTGGILPLALS